VDELPAFRDARGQAEPGEHDPHRGESRADRQRDGHPIDERAAYIGRKRGRAELPRHRDPAKEAALNHRRCGWWKRGNLRLDPELVEIPLYQPISAADAGRFCA
jgi:hypothetical protein